MSKIGVEISIDVTKIDKSKIYQGQKGKYLKLTTFIDLYKKDKYDNNGFITQSITKEEQQNGVKGVILGNCKIFWDDGKKDHGVQAENNQDTGYDDRNIPF